MGYIKQKEIEEQEISDMMEEDKDLMQSLYTREEEERMMKFLMEELEKEERLAVIDYYISIIALSLISLTIGYWIARIWS